MQKLALRSHLIVKPSLGGHVFAHLGIEVVTATYAQIKNLASDPDVASVSLDRPLKLSTCAADTATETVTAVTSFGATRSEWTGGRRQRCRIAGVW